MNAPNSSRQRASAFTLIELLTVIAIIAILMALLFPAIASVKETARRTQAKSDEMNIVAAVKAFYTEYGKYPTITSAATGSGGGSGSGATADTLVGDVNQGSGLSPTPTDNCHLFDILRNISDSLDNSNYEGNPRHVVFFEGKEVTNSAVPKAGFLDNTTGVSGAAANEKGGFFDPWGTEYFVMIDTNYNNQLDIGTIYTDFQTNLPQTGVGSFSFGKDQVCGSTTNKNMYKSGSTVSDDVISWQ